MRIKKAKVISDTFPKSLFIRVAYKTDVIANVLYLS